MFGRALSTIGSLLLLPAILLHELTHYVVAKPVSDEIAFDVNPTQPGVMVRWTEGVPEWRLKLAKVAPTIVGLALGPLLALWIIRGPTTNALATILIVALWGVYSWPSGNDLKPPIRGERAQ